MAADEDHQQLDTTIAALSGGSLTGATALGLVDQWRERLGREDDPHLREIANDLATLSDAMTAEVVDPALIAGLLQGLGDRTDAVAAGSPEFGAQLQLLANALREDPR